jgi:photosystem II stability/assembly factor-like uncharacterized protein
MNWFIKIYSLLFFWVASTNLYAQSPTIQLLEQGRKTSIRGMSVVSDSTIWVSGSNGSVGKSRDGGTTWTWMTVKGYEKRDFRDIEAINDTTAIILGIAEPAILLKTKDGGNSWHLVFEDSTKGVFLDAMDFIKENESYSGIAIGDPLNQEAYILTTKNAGDSWTRLISNDQPPFLKEEAFFASSGTNILFSKARKTSMVYFVTGGGASRLMCAPIPFNSSMISIPLLQGSSSTGANSIALSATGDKAVIVGGDFFKDTLSSGNCVLVQLSSNEGSVQFTQPQTNPHGYRSCVIYTSKNKLITCGTSGVDISTDGGTNWQLISRESFHVVQKAKQGKAIFLAGSNGKIAKLSSF